MPHAVLEQLEERNRSYPIKYDTDPRGNPDPNPNPEPNQVSLLGSYRQHVRTGATAGRPPSMMRMAAAQTRRTKRLVTNLTFLITLLLYLACGVGGYYRAPGGMPAPNVL